MNNIDIRYTLLWIDDQPSTSFMDLAYEDPFRIDIRNEPLFYGERIAASTLNEASNETP